MTDSLDTSEGEAMPWVKPAQSESGDEDAQTMTKEERALGAFLAAMHDSKLDGGNMRAAMLKVLGLGASTAERLHELEEEIAVSDKLLEHRQQLLQAIPACPAHGHGCVPHALDWIEQQKRGKTADAKGAGDFRLALHVQQDGEPINAPEIAKKAGWDGKAALHLTVTGNIRSNWMTAQHDQQGRSAV